MLVDTLDEFIDTLLVFQTLTPQPLHPTRRVVLFGNGGGTRCLATDCFARLGLDVTPFNQPALDALAVLRLPPGTSITNPVDCPVSVTSSRMMDASPKETLTRSMLKANPERS